LSLYTPPVASTDELFSEIFGGELYGDLFTVVVLPKLIKLDDLEELKVVTRFP
jgi:hypothetical protein